MTDSARVNISSIDTGDDRLEQFINATFEGLIFHDQGTILNINPAAGHILGYQEGELIGRHIQEFLAPDCHSEFAASLVADREGPYDFDFIHKNTTYVHTVARCKSIRQWGKSVQILGLHEVTQFKVTEKALRASEQRFRRYFDLGLIGMATTSLKKGWVDFNDRLCEMLGYSREELAQLTWTDITHPDDLAAGVEHFNRIMAGRGESDVFQIDKRYFRKDGSILYVTVSANCVRNDEGEPEYFVSMVQDITPKILAQRQRDRFFTLSVDMLGIGNFEGYFTDLSPAWENCLGYNRAELQRVPFIEFVHPDDRERTIKEAQRLTLEPNATINFSNRCRTKSGDYRWLLWNAIGLQDEQCIYSVAHDFTDFKVIESELRLHKTQLEQLVKESADEVTSQARIIDQIRDAVVATNLDGVITSWNQGAERLFGYSADEVIGKGIDLIYPPAERASLQEALFAPVFELGAHECEKLLHHKDGTDFFAHISLSVLRNAEGSIHGAIAYCMDISDQKRAEQQLQMSESRYRSLFELSDDANMVLDAEQFLDCNQATLNMFGYASKQEFLGKHPGEISPPIQADGTESRIAANERIATAYENGRNFFEWTHRRANGEEFPAEVLLTPMKLGDRYVLQAIVRDITAHKQTESALRLAKEQAESASRSKSEFLTNMSHELRTPMHGILSFAQLGISRIENLNADKLRDYFQHIQVSGNRLLLLLNDLLDLSKLEAGKMILDFESHNLRDIAATCIQEQAPVIKGRNIICSIECDGSDTDLTCDKNRIIQVVTNLLSNAIKFSPDGGQVVIKIEASNLQDPLAGEEADPCRALRMSISDQGKGLPEDELKLVFDKFAQGSQKEAVHGGTGLGLSICNEIIKLHHGHIWADNNPPNQGGALFTFEIPVANPYIGAAADEVA